MGHGTAGEEPNGFVPGAVFEQIGRRVQAARTMRRFADVTMARMVLDHRDLVVQDEQAGGKPVRQGGLAERAFATHLAILLGESRNRSLSILHAAIAIRAMPACWAAFQQAAFGWQAVEAIVRNSGALTGEARDAYAAGAARLAADTVPQRLDPLLSRLHDSLDHDAATQHGAHAHRDRGVRARPAAQGMAELILRGPAFDIAAVYDAAHTLAVAAHGKPGEDRTIQQLMYDVLLDLILGGATVAPAAPGVDVGSDGDGGDDAPSGPAAPANIDRGADGSFTPATPFERLGDPRVPQRKVIHTEILVTVPAANAAGAADAPGRLAGWGSLPAAEIRRLVASSRYWTRIETDPVDDAILAFDRQQRPIPIGLRRLIWARSETCDEPGCPTGAHRAEIDHAVRVEHGGRTMELNLSALCRPAHQTKDDGYMDVRRTPDGLIWRTRWGAETLTPNTMTIRRRAEPLTIDPDDPAPFDLPRG